MDILPSRDKLPINTISDRLIMTKTFLQYVAKDLLAKHPDGLARVAVVFPNKRASLFLNRALAETARQAAKAEGRMVTPLWSPAYITISELFRHHSSLTVPQDIDLVFTLYQSYCTATGQKPNDDDNNNIGHFYGWGQKLLADFDDVDKTWHLSTNSSAMWKPMKIWGLTSLISVKNNDVASVTSFISSIPTLLI